ncbi:hypothetical protein T440DRAFT_454699 [Plenodomus tracheiphilus IPT5]|uniref:Cora-domain-containing protein n=1 Tax=Plenodomus tracheiphilus IPT5 TaxID=1408161 RepID=A0A6A7B0N3_9PLEO|nr:hypothetical protein T440DRAFT_454699 [Plenodomus tracheiphilus IPT5]
MASSGLHRSKSDPPPPIMVEDVETGDGPLPSPSPSKMNPPRASTTYTRPTFDRADSSPQLLRDRSTRKPTLGHRRKHSPNLEWREKWTPESWKSGRVLLIDYVDRAHSPEGKMKIIAQEFCDIDSLRRFYRKEHLSAQAALRVIHVQNASWATRFLLRKYNIDANDDLVGTTFGRWARYDRPQQRGGKPVLNGRTFRSQRDPWRGISRTSFGCDYLKHYPRGTVHDKIFNQKPMMELNHYNMNDQPAYGFDVYVQRLSVYVQLSDGKPGQAVDPDIPNPYDEEAYEEYQRLKRQYGNVDANEHREMYVPKLRTLDNGNTIILFENSVSGGVKDTLIGARQELESRWRRLTFYLPREEIDNDDSLATECMDFILKDIFKAIAYSWDKFLVVCETHVSILEDKIYENPADESRAPELWKNSAQWLKVERLIYIHADVSREVRTNLHELFGSDPRPDALWLGSSPDDIDKLTGQWERDIVGPTTALSDLMYKSVGIRDARHSLQLGLSMWRLSWITFIFLPLTFTVGFFGMNVDVFAENPNLKWWFITSVPVLLTVIILWYGVKHNLSSQRQNPLRRGVYEALYYEFSTAHASLWTRGGPRDDVVPVGWWGVLRWRLMTRWFGREKLRLGRGGVDPAATEEFGSWSRVKRWLVRRWLNELVVMPRPPALPNPNTDSEVVKDTTGSAVGDQDTMISEELIPFKELRLQAHHQHDRGGSAVGELLSIATPVAIAELDPTAASRMARTMSSQHSGHRSLSPVASEGRPGSSGGRSSDGGVMVEEMGVGEDERSGDEGVVVNGVGHRVGLRGGGGGGGARTVGKRGEEGRLGVD